jgi:hypothetical protein
LNAWVFVVADGELAVKRNGVDVVERAGSGSPIRRSKTSGRRDMQDQRSDRLAPMRRKEWKTGQSRTSESACACSGNLGWTGEQQVLAS